MGSGEELKEPDGAEKSPEGGAAAGGGAEEEDEMWNGMETLVLCELVRVHNTAQEGAGAAGGVPAPDSSVWHGVASGMQGRFQDIGLHSKQFFTLKRCHDKYVALRQMYPAASDGAFRSCVSACAHMRCACV